MMAKYTITIKTLIDNNFDFQMTNYPIFDENYRETLNHNILYHYYENEIGFETAPLFRFYLNQKLNEIMPYYNELYKAQKKLIDENLLLNNVNITEQLQGSNTNNTTTTGNSTSQSTNNGTSNNKNLFQDTPQGEISNTDINNQKWATNLTLDSNTSNNTINDTSSNNGTANNTSSNSGTANVQGTNNYIKTIIGNNGGKFNIDILNDIKNNLMNIDLMIINDLNELFMQIF